jgi:glyoxylate/hydroxypyruvate reductase A
MGRTVAQRLAAIGYRVTGWSTTPRADVGVAGVASCSGEAALGALLADAQVVINLLPLTAATRGLIDARFLAQMARGAGIVNLARGGHVVEHDLLAALDRGDLDHAVLDVFTNEPLPADHPFWRHPRITVLPHTAAQTDPRSAAPAAARNVQRWRDGTAVEGLVDRNRGY